MNAHARKCRAVCGRGLAAIIAVGLAATAADAMEAQSTALSSPASPSALPSFLDVERLPDLQQAWQNRFDSAPAAGDVIPSHPVPNAGAAGRSSSARSRAEELSHRFAFDADTASQPSAPPAAASAPQQPVPSAPAATAAIDRAAQPVTPDVQHVLSPIDIEPIEEPVTSSISADADDAADAASDPIARVLDDASPEPDTSSAASVADAVAQPASQPVTAAADAAQPLQRAVTIALPVRKSLPKTAQRDRALIKKPDAGDAAKVATQKRGEKRTPAAAVTATRKTSAAPKQLATSKPSGPLYYFNSSSPNSATAPDRHILMPSEIKSFGWSD